MVKPDRVDHESEGFDEGGSVCGGVAPNTHMETRNWTSVVSWKILLSACQPNKVGADLAMYDFNAHKTKQKHKRDQMHVHKTNEIY